MAKKLEFINRKSGFNFHVEQKYIAGLQLSGTEVKSLRIGNINMGDAYCAMESGEMWVKNMHISKYENGSYNSHEPLRPRKLLLTKQELKKIDLKIKSKGYAAFPIRIFEDEHGKFKLEMGLGQGKKLFDKRADLKEKDVKRDLDRY